MDPSDAPKKTPAATRHPEAVSESQRHLEHFRAKAKRVQIHPLEKAVLWVVCAHMVFLPWALGTMRPWAQWISFGFSVVSFALALLPRNYTEQYSNEGQFRLIMWPKLTKFPIFWIGLALLAYVAIQALNPAWKYQTDGRLVWAEPLPFIKWLPRGVDAPFEKWNQWRMLVIYSSALMTVCAIWVAFTRRRTVLIFLATLAFNGLAVALFGITHRLLGNGKLFWVITPPSNTLPHAGFVYKNHAGAYLNLALAVTCGLAGWYYLRGVRRMAKSNPSGVLVFFATCIAVSIVTSYARGATLMMLGFLLACLAAFVIHQFRLPKESRKPAIAIGLLLFFGFFLKIGSDGLRTGEAWNKIQRGIARKDLSLDTREWAKRASLEMLRDNWTTGVGAGSFRFTFPLYQFQHPELVKWPDGRGMYWEHAHCDVLQFPIELGILGLGMIVLGFGYWLLVLTRRSFWKDPLSAIVVFGLLLTVAYAWMDFPFQNPAILITWCALWPATALRSKFEGAASKE